ncbi:hypothetical protein U9R90_32920 [Streptomyces sp. E11-3]|uniref:COG4315 family predicted lipoprotein n=1 Tax=Streptomyces sp. E11-3 TaxID=3110112 RepID=UPI00398107B7
MRVRITLLAAPLALVLAACGGGGSADTAAPRPSQTAAERPGAEAPAAEGGGPAAQPDAPEIEVQVVKSNFGPILADQAGRTLYGFTKDKDGASNCDADCIAVWPALISPSKVGAGSGADGDLLRQSEQGEGIVQAVYGDWPLYYYVGDAAPGDINGQGLDEEWFVVAPDGKLIK